MALDFVQRAAVWLAQRRSSASRVPHHEADSGTHEAWRAGAFGEADLPVGMSIDSMTSEALLAWENREIPCIDRPSDMSESDSDVKQDIASSLSFPLHPTTARESWDYLFDFAVACELLGPRPDDLVLDLAAGTCWATEFLNRLGIRTVSIDLSAEMMRRGRDRLATDSRLVFRHDALFVSGRGQALPFANETFDGVLCMNALHHHPSYAVALQEIFRVLKHGGRAVFSEPGTAHADQPLSQFRMREERVMEKPVALSHVRRLAKDAGFSRMRVIPLRSASSYVFDYSATPADGAPLQMMWNDTLRECPREHARFVLHKGDDPPQDTLLPSHKLVRKLNARIVPERVADLIHAGEAFTDRLRVTNDGAVTWKARGRRFGGQVTCGLKIFDTHGALLREDLGRTPLPHDVSPGHVIDLDVTVPGALPPGRYEFRYDMVVEGLTWFEFQGSACFSRTVEVI
jgi:ubiquinone/menaquinone biosynthesis C-methylase UbiE